MKQFASRITQNHLWRSLIVVGGLVLAILSISVPHLLAQQAVVVNLEFDYIRQGSLGVVTLSGSDVVGGVATALGRTYPFFPTSKGYASLVTAPLDQKIQDYPLTVTIMTRSGATAHWDGTLKVASGEFVAETPYILPSDKLFLLADQIQKSEDEKLISTYSMVTPAHYWEGTFSPPVNGAFTAPFGSWRIYNGGIRSRHTGQDFRAVSGTPVLASANGRVALSQPLDIHGESVIIDHGWGIFTEYSHMTTRFVVPGQFVLQGDILGLSGTTGRSTGPHVHWEVAVNGIWVNPITFLQTKLPN
ncbi:MAG: M23 family metallopeptidase [Chloroflexota bacterium]